MADESQTRDIRRALADDVAGLRHHAGAVVALGVFLVVLGVLAIGASFVATLATVVVFGALLVAGSVAQFANASLGRGKANFALHIAAGALYLVAGLLMIARPLQAAAAVTLLLVAFFLVAGALRVVMALAERPHGFGWLLLLGALNLLLGGILWYGWPWTSLWFLGLFVGIEMIFGGIFWLSVGYAARRAA